MYPLLPGLAIVETNVNVVPAATTKTSAKLNPTRLVDLISKTTFKTFNNHRLAKFVQLVHQPIDFPAKLTAAQRHTLGNRTPENNRVGFRNLLLPTHLGVNGLDDPPSGQLDGLGDLGKFGLIHCWFLVDLCFLNSVGLDGHNSAQALHWVLAGVEVVDLATLPLAENAGGRGVGPVEGVGFPVDEDVEVLMGGVHNNSCWFTLIIIIKKESNVNMIFYFQKLTLQVIISEHFDLNFNILRNIKFFQLIDNLTGWINKIQ